MHPRELKTGQGRSDGLVALVDPACRKQRLISRAALRIGRKQHQARRMPIDAMQRHQVGIVQAADQAAQQGLLDIFPAGVTGRKCGLSATTRCSST